MQAHGDGRALRSVALQFWVNGVVLASFTPRLPEIRDRIGVDLGTLGFLMTVASVGGLVGSAVCGRVIERIGTKVAMTAGSLAMALALPIVGFANGPVAFLVGIALLSTLDVLADVSMNLQASWLSARREVPVINRLHGLWSVGTLVGGVAAAIAASTLSLGVHLVAVSVVLVVTVLYVTPGLLGDDERPEPAEQPGRGVARRAAAVFVLLGAAAGVAEIVPSNWSALRLTDDLGAGPSTAGLGYVAMSAGMVTGRFAGDHVSVRLGPDRLVRLTVAMAITGSAAATLVPSVAVSIAGFVLAGVGVAVLFPRIYDEAARAAGRPGAMLGAMSVGMRASLLGAPSLVGALAATGALGVGHAIAIVVIPAGVVILALRDGPWISQRWRRARRGRRR